MIQERGFYAVSLIQFESGLIQQIFYHLTINFIQRLCTSHSWYSATYIDTLIFDTIQQRKSNSIDCLLCGLRTVLFISSLWHVVRSEHLRKFLFSLFFNIWIVWKDIINPCKHLQLLIGELNSVLNTVISDSITVTGATVHIWSSLWTHHHQSPECFTSHFITSSHKHTI